jgi:hypothetical protein
MTIVVRLILIALLLWLLVSLFQKLAPEVQKFLRWNSFQSEWKHLLHLCGGDHERASRLLQHEKNATPGLSDVEACRRAIGRYYRDNSQQR